MQKLSRHRRSVSNETEFYKWEFFNLTGDVIDIGGSTDLANDHIQTNENATENKETNNIKPVNNSKSLLDEWKWKREEIDTELGYFYDVAWEPDPFTGKRSDK